MSIKIIFALFLAIICVQFTRAEDHIDLSDDELEDSYLHINTTHGSRDGRVFPFLAVVKLGTERCGNTKGGQGVCKLKKQCDQDNGSDLGISCGNGYGVCCSISTSCSASNTGKPLTVRSSGTHLTNPSGYTPPSTCRFQLKKPKGVSQVRLDFIAFSMMGPNTNGDCDTDMMTISGADNLNSFSTCGINTGQHLYLHYGASDSISVSFILNSVGASYDVLVSYIRCDDCSTSGKNKKSGRVSRKFTSSGSSGSGNKNKNNNNNNNNDDDSTEVECAPEGCSQYYTKPSDTVQSFDYVKLADPQNNPNTYQINNEMYTVCVKTLSGSNQITWRECDTNAQDGFLISKDASTSLSLTGADCTGDYVDILGSPGGRYCGSDFPVNVVSTAKPYMMYVNFNQEELAGLNNPVNPATGCQIEFDCTDPNTGANVPGVCPDPTWCIPSLFLIGRTDFSNYGFCLSYTVA